MENELFLNAGTPAAAAATTMPIWPSSSAMEIQSANEMNCSSEQSSDCFFNPNWEKSTNRSLPFDSARTSMLSSPVASNSNMSNESFVIRELIGKLSNIGNSFGESAPHSVSPYYNNNGNNSTNTSCYTTPLSSPPKVNLPIMDHFVKEKLPTLGNSMALNSSVAELSADPGFAERAAKFSLFGSRSFNGSRTCQFVPSNNPAEFGLRSNPMMANEKLPRIVSSPSMKVVGYQGNKNCHPLQDRSELANSQEESSVSEQVLNGDSVLRPSNEFNSRKRKAVSRGKGKEPAASPSAKVADANENSNNKKCRPNQNCAAEKTEEEPKNAGDDDKQGKANTKPPEPPKDYIHVRARRGQATDSHSLAERVRREKISERMKLLQDLVPGCNKVTGKALMLDEIINYVQSLQRQVEFLSMKLASVNTRLDFNVDALTPKDMYQPNKALAHSIFPIDSTASTFFTHQPQQNPAIHCNISNGTMTQCSVDPLDNTLCSNLINLQLPQQPDQFIPQFQNLCEDDLQSIVQMGFGQNLNCETSQSQSFQGSSHTSHMKIEH